MNSSVHSKQPESGLRFRAFSTVALAWVALVLSACGSPEHVSAPPVDEARPTDIEIEFRNACRSLLDLPPVVPSVGDVVVGRQGWILMMRDLQFHGDEKAWLGNRGAQEGPPPREAVDPLTAILYFDRELRKRGIILVVVPVPERSLVFPESVLDPSRFEDNPRVPHLSRWRRAFFDSLESNGCAAVDLTPTFLDQRSSDRGPVFVPTESHWTGHGMVVAGSEIAAVVERQDWYAAWGKTSIQQEWLTIDHNGDLAERFREGLRGVDVVPPGLDGVALAPTRMQIRRVTATVGGRSIPIEQRNPESPVVILGDSYTAFGAESGFSLGHQLAYELGFPVDVMPTKGGGANAARMNLIRAAKSDPSYLAGKRCVIWCFATRIMAGEQWFPTFFPE